MPDEQQGNSTSAGFRAFTYILGLLSVIGGVYTMVELRFGRTSERFTVVEIKLEALKELMTVNQRGLRTNVDNLTKWRDAWAQRVIELDEHQNGRHAASELETRRIREHLGMP